MPYLPENPWMPERCPAYHYAVNSVSVKCFPSLFRRIDVPVADDWNMHPRIVLYLTYKSPVCLALVHLAPGPSVYGKCLNAGILKSFCQIHYDFRVLVPAETGLYGHRLLHGVHYHFRDHHHLVRLPHHPRAGSASCNLAHRTAEVDVNQIAAVAPGYFSGGFRHPGSLHHRIRIVSVDLDAYRGFLVRGLHLGDGLGGIPDEAV